MGGIVSEGGRARGGPNTIVDARAGLGGCFRAYSRRRYAELVCNSEGVF